MVLTAGLAGVHDLVPEYGIDVADLGDCYSIAADPTVSKVRKAGELLGEDVWIAITVPGEAEGAAGDPHEGVDVIAQWTSVVVDADRGGDGRIRRRRHRGTEDTGSI
jgi:hypothetical protein